MKINVASQSIGAQMITAADGTNFTGTVTVVITIDNGTQSASGGTAPAHEGNGYHSYTPTQAETNGAHIAFTFTGSGAITATVQVYTSFPQTGDNFARTGAPVGASISADIAANGAAIDGVATQIDGIEGATFDTSTDSLEAIRNRGDAAWTTGAGGSSPTVAEIADGVWDEVLSAHVTAGTTGKALADIEVDTAEIGTAGAGLTNISLPNQTMDITGNLSGSVGSVTGAAGSVTGAVGSVAGNVDGSIGSLGATAKTEVNTEVDNALDTVIPSSPTLGSLNALVRGSVPRKNVALSDLEFLMVDATDFTTPVIGLTLAGTRSIDGGAFAVVAGTIAEVANGIYQFDATAADMNGSIITFRFTATGAADRYITLRTSG